MSYVLRFASRTPLLLIFGRSLFAVFKIFAPDEARFGRFPRCMSRLLKSKFQTVTVLPVELLTKKPNALSVK